MSSHDRYALLWLISLWIAMGIFATVLRLAFTRMGYDCKTIFRDMPVAATIVVLLHVFAWAFADFLINAFWSWGCALNISHFRRYSRN